MQWRKSYVYSLMALSNKQKLFNYMETHDDNDMPDGAWQAMLQGAVEEFNEDNGTNHDPYDMFLEYVEWSQQKHGIIRDNEESGLSEQSDEDDDLAELGG